MLRKISPNSVSTINLVDNSILDKISNNPKIIRQMLSVFSLVGRKNRINKMIAVGMINSNPKKLINSAMINNLTHVPKLAPEMKFELLFILKKPLFVKLQIILLNRAEL